MSMWRWALAAVLVSSVYGCDSGDSEGNEAAGGSTEGAGASRGETPSGTPTWHQDIAPIISENCAGCHHEGGIGPFALETYEQAAPLAGLILDSVQSGRMPPWGADETDSCSPRLGFKDDLRLTDAQLSALAGWQAAEAPEGDPATAAEIVERRVDTLARVDRALTPKIPFTTQGDTDQFRCFVLDPGFTEETFVNAVHFEPGDPRVVHHLLLYVDQEGEEATELGGEEGAYDCFGGPRAGDDFLVAAWAPGGVPTELPENAAFPIQAGAKFVLQVHYHPLGDEPAEDLTTTQLQILDHTPEYTAFTALLGNFDSLEGEADGLLPGMNDPAEGPAFMIPAGAEGHTERMAYTIPGTFDDRPFPGMFLYSVASHMHYVGTDMQIDLVRTEQVPMCSADELAPLQACMDEACPGLTGIQSVVCATMSCEEHVDALSSNCGGCLEYEALNGAEDAFAPCSVVRVPEQYGELPEQPENECLLQTPNWNFEWQRFYTYEAPIEELPFVVAGDRFEFECTFDNSMANPFVREALAEQGLDTPQDVVLGDETLDEMCLFAVTVLFKWE
ncbi:MAG: hypothetical protein ACE366_18065 [Bradymonadia bacterium]